MALYHFSAHIISRNTGESACAAAAYRSGQKITNEYDGITHDYRKKHNVEYSVVMLPENAPADFADRGILWNSVEQNEKQANAQLAREYEFALPRELPPEVRQRIALEFIQENLVAEGMIVDVCFHDPPKMNSNKQPIDAEGNVTTDPAKFIYNNPHVHAMTPLRPIDESGQWEIKRHKLFVCEKSGQIGRFTAAELKNNPGWQKQYHYVDAEGHKSWHTKTYAAEHPELSLVNRYPRSENAMNPIVEKWNSKEFLVSLRSAWAEKVNVAFEEFGMSITVDYRSYIDQGLDLIPTIHEGKAITIAEKRLKEEYEQKIARGEQAVLQHTEIRELNNAIREHNEEIRIIMEIEKLRKIMERIIEPVKIRIETIGQSVAETLERIRAEIISIRIKIKDAVEVKGQADEQISIKSGFIKDLAPLQAERIDELMAQRKTLKKQYDVMTGIFDKKKRDALAIRIERLDDAINLQKENQRYAIEAQKEIDELKVVSQSMQERITEMKDEYNHRVEEYHNTEQTICPDQMDYINTERVSIRQQIEDEYVSPLKKNSFKMEAERTDIKLGCSVLDLSDSHIESMKPRVKMSLD